MSAATITPIPSSRGTLSRDFTAYLGMVIGLIVFGMLFAALFFAYGVVRIDAPVWPPAGETRLPIALPFVNTMVLLASSASAFMAARAVRDRRPAWRWLVETLVLGAVFLGLQFVVWRGVWLSGLRPSSGIYGSVFYALTAIHAVHVLAGMIALLVMLVPALRREGGLNERQRRAVGLCSMFWHFVDVVWVLMFFAVYVF